MQRKWLLTGGTFFCTGALLVLLYYGNREPVLKAQVSPLELVQGEGLTYADNTAGATEWRWEFGLDSLSTARRGSFHYKMPGTYTVRVTVNNSLTRDFTVRVIPPPPPRDTTVSLLADAVGYEGQQLTFKTLGASVQQVAWQFGESKQVDSNKPTAFYVYNKPGKYEVILHTNVSAKDLKHEIEILPRFHLSDKQVDTLAEDKTKETKDIRRHLQFIAQGREVNRHYSYLLNRYLCQNPNAPVVVGSLPPHDFYSYCMNLQFDPGWIIDSVAIALAADSKCVTQLTVTQHKSEE